MARDNVTFRFNIDLSQMTAKGRDAVKILQDLEKASGRAATGMTRLGSSSKTAADQSAAAAVNFQTTTQGMLNLSTAAVQTYTSISNLDRAGNRLAQSQIAVARATDLMNNKELRLKTIRDQGLGTTKQATNLTNELKTARADLLVKTDKLKIEEGALFDIQLLFVTNVANVMISSLQTIVSLKNAHVLATIRQITQEKLLATTMFSKTVPAFAAVTAAGASMNVMTKTVINTNRLLMVGIPGIGTAILAVSLAIQAYTDNWGGFRDMVQSILPFMKDQKALLNDVNGVLGEVTDSQDGFNKSLDTESKLLFDLPKSLNLTVEGLANINKEYGKDKLGNMKAFNDELKRTNELAADSGQLFPNASHNGGFNSKTANSSNIIPHEGDTTSTPSAINHNSLSAQIGNPQSSSVLQQFGYAPSDQRQEAQIARSSFAGVSLSIGGGFPQGEPQPAVMPTLESRMYDSQQSRSERLAAFISSGITESMIDLKILAGNINDELFKDRMVIDEQGKGTTEILPPTAIRSLGMGIESFLQFHSIKSEQRLAKRELDQELRDAKYRGFNSIDEMRDFNNERRLEQIPINTFKRTLTPENLKIFENLERAYPNQKNLAELKSLYSFQIPKVEPGPPRFIGGRGMSAVSGQGIMYGTKQFEFIKGQLEDKNSDIYKDYSPEHIKEFEKMVRNVETDENAAALLLSQDAILRSVDPRVTTQENQEEFFKDLAETKSKNDAIGLLEEIKRIEKETEDARLLQIANAGGYDDKGVLNLSVNDVIRREKLGGGRWGTLDGVLKRVGTGIAGDLLKYGHKTLTDEQMNTLKGYGGIVNIGGYVSGMDDITRADMRTAAGQKQYSDQVASQEPLLEDWWKNNNPYRVYTPELALDAMKVRKRLEEGNTESFVGSKGKMIGGLPTDTVFDKIVKETYMNKFSPDGTMYNSQGINKGVIYNTKELAMLMEYDDWGDNRKSAYDKWGVDIGKAAENYSKADAERFGMYQAIGKTMNGQVGGQQYTNLFSSFGGSATAAYQVKRNEDGSSPIRASADFYARNIMRDSNTNRLNLMGATRVEGIPMDEEGAVVGGAVSRREYQNQIRNRNMIRDNANRQLGAFFGVGIDYSRIYGRSSARAQTSRLNSRVDSIRSALASAGLSYKTTSARYRRGQGPAQYAAVMAEWASVRSFNASQLSKAAEINTLQQGFGLTGFSGSTMSLPSLQDEVAKQDEMIKTIGLNRTEAFQIIDTQGRGRDEIDARVLWKNRVNNISTGTSVL